MKRFWTLSSLFILLPFMAQAFTGVRYSSTTIEASRDESLNVFQLTNDSLSGDASSQSGALEVYIPVDTGNAQGNYFIKGPSYGVPEIESGGSGFLYVPLNVKNVSGTTHHLHYAVEISEDTFAVFDVSTTTIGDDADTDRTETINFSDMCAAVVGLDCSKTAGTDQTSETYTLYFFSSSTTYAAGTQIDLDTEDNGVYMELKASSSLPTTTVSFTSLLRGDGQLTASYSGSSLGTNMTVYSFVYNSVGVASALTDRTLGANFDHGKINELEQNDATGDVVIDDLLNEEEVAVAIGFYNEYGFSTQLSNVRAQTPSLIEGFIDKQACYLLSAGFGQDHYVVEYFREFRDYVMRRFALGRFFIEMYYGSAPKLTHLVYENPAVAATVRTLGHIFYLFFNGAWVLLPLAFLGFILKRKIKPVY
jgi:hypothetical protein